MPNQRFEQTLTARKRDYGVALNSEAVQGLVNYFALLTRWNERLHLVAPCEPEEFATRHVLESLLVLRFLPSGAAVVDIGSGAGLPIIPCLIARPDLSATLIESSQKKSVFLREALNQLDLSAQAKIIPKTFEDAATPQVDYVTCRALDQFTNKVPALFKWAPEESVLLLFGGETLSQKLDELPLSYTEFLIPFSEKRFIYEAVKTKAH
jgi:16S rRNA (guanine527-N7)-methyltransferase